MNVVDFSTIVTDYYETFTRNPKKILSMPIIYIIFVNFLFLSRGSLFCYADSDVNLEHNTCEGLTPDCETVNSAEFKRNDFPVSRVYKSKNTTGVHVFDNVFSLASLLILERYNEIAATWRYSTSTMHGLVPWTAQFNPKLISGTTFGKTLQQMVVAVGGKNDIKLSDIRLNILRRQDPVKVFFGSDTIGSDFTAVVYMNQIWRKNDYGDAIFYEKDADLAFASIKPKYGRLLVFDSSIGYLCRPPSVNFRAGQLFLVARFSTNQTRVEEMQEKFEADVEAKKKNTIELFHSMSERDTKADIGEHLVKQHQSANGKRILVFDNLFVDEDLEKIRHHVLNYGDFYYDDSFDFDSDNVVWIAAFSVDDFVGSHLWPIVQQVASFSSGKESWFPYDISCNIVRSADCTRIHEDCEEHEDEWTFLLYLNPDWSPDYYGETAFFETKDDDSEVIATVLPKYGRVAIFEGIIPHSARPPSSTYNGTRLSFAVKLSVTEKVARKKLFKQSFNQELGLHNAALNILQTHDQPEFESSFKRSLMAQIEEQRKVDWRLAAYTFRGATTDSSSMEEYAGVDDEYDIEDDEEEDFQLMTERQEYTYSLLDRIADDVDELKHHYEQFSQEFNTFSNEYINKLLNIL